jgi:formylmethanofuran dehydrogenase subunit B
VAGAIAALLSSCGLPRAVSFHDGTPRPIAGDPIAVADAVLHVGPKIVVGRDEVIIPTAVPALSERGVWLRADGVPVTLTGPVASDLPRQGDVLRLLLDALEAP